MIEMFVGSSTESENLAKKIARRIRKELPVISLLHWRNACPPGQYTLSSLISAAEKSQLALLLFSADDIVSSRDQQRPAPRDNILLEAGLFLSRLGPRRVALVMEEGVKFPTDLSGLIHIKFSGASTPEKIANEVAKQLKETWRPIRDPGDLGVEPTLRQMERHSAAQAESLYFPDGEAQQPVIIDSRPCTGVYLDGLRRVSKRFWTTSFLTSAFWTGSEVDSMLSANRNMLKKLSGHDNGSARRAFLLPEDPEQFVLSQKREVRKLRQAGDRLALQEMKSGITKLRKHVQRMAIDGFETRVVYDSGNRAWNNLIKIFHVLHRPNDTEIAIYDHFRVDLFMGGAHGITDQVICFFDGMRDFGNYLSASEEYFQDVWDTGEHGVKFISLCEEAIYRAGDEIDYTPNWLSRYDYRLSEDDEKLKEQELELTIKFVKDHFLDKPVSNYLDIGSCTARYPIRLLRSGLLKESPEVIALENDEDAWLLMRAKLQMPDFAHEEVHITPLLSDFMLWDAASHPRRFDLMTCMLGTISHLAAPGPEGKSRLHSAIERMTSSLAPEGVLIIGCWSEEAIRRNDFLAIYTPHDSLLLSKWSPTRAEMVAAVNGCGLDHTMVHFAARMDLYVCTHKGQEDRKARRLRVE